jgi:hypothetical protein
MEYALSIAAKEGDDVKGVDRSARAQGKVGKGLRF